MILALIVTLQTTSAAYAYAGYPYAYGLGYRGYYGGYYGRGYRRAEEEVERPDDEIPEDEIEVAPERLPIEVSLATPIQRHPEDCTVYFIYNIPYKCPEGMAYDMKDLACVEEDAADCPRPTPCDLKRSRLLQAAEDEDEL